MFDAKESILPNGIKLVAIKKDTRMMALHAGIKIGSVYENVDEKGISHFIEHMLFKGTKSRNNEKLNRDLEALGESIMPIRILVLQCIALQHYG